MPLFDPGDSNQRKFCGMKQCPLGPRTGPRAPRRPTIPHFRPADRRQVIKGWTEAMQLMKEGDKWELAIPSELGYGERGSGAKIPGGAVLIFELEMIKVGTTQENDERRNERKKRTEETDERNERKNERRNEQKDRRERL